MNMQIVDMNPHADLPSMLQDKPLPGHEILADDKLGRAPFARTVAKVLERVSGASGLVVSIEGTWGSGKTTTRLSGTLDVAESPSRFADPRERNGSSRPSLESPEKDRLAL